MCQCHRWCSLLLMITMASGQDGVQVLTIDQIGENLNVTLIPLTSGGSSKTEYKLSHEMPTQSVFISEVTQNSSSHDPHVNKDLCDCSFPEDKMSPEERIDRIDIREDGEYEDNGNFNETGEETWQECPTLNSSPLVQEGFQRAVINGLKRCAELWCNQVQGTEARQHLEGTYHVIQLGYIEEEDHQCLLNITRMVVLHHSWPMCTSDFICATNHSVFEMSASDCMPVHCLAAESVVFVFMILVSACIVTMSILIMIVIVLCPQFHKPKYYLRLSLAATDFIIGIVVCGHAAYNQWVGLTEVPLERFPYYANLKAHQLFRHVPNCLWGVSDVFTQISGFFAASNMIISLYTLSLMSFDRYLLLTRTHYRSLVTSRRVTGALIVSWCCGLLVPSLHFVYRPQKQNDICVNYDTSPFDVHIINNESKIATADYKVYLRHIVPLSVTVVVLGIPVITLLVFSFRTLRKYNSYTRDHSVRQVKSALQLTQSHCSLSRQVSVNSLSAMVNLSATTSPNTVYCHGASRYPKGHAATPPGCKLKFTFKKNSSHSSEDQLSTRYEQGLGGTKIATSTLTENSATASAVPTSLDEEGAGNVLDPIEFPRINRKESQEEEKKEKNRWSLFKFLMKSRNSNLQQDSAKMFSLESETAADSSLGTNSIAGGGSSRASPSRESVLGVLGLRRIMAASPGSDHVAATIRRIRGGIASSGERVTVRERDREITCTVLVNIVVFVFACFPLLAVGGWMMFLYFTQQDTINNRAPLKQLLFVAPWLMALNSLWNAVLHLSYNHKFRSATRHLFFSHWQKLVSIFSRRRR